MRAAFLALVWAAKAWWRLESKSQRRLGAPATRPRARPRRLWRVRTPVARSVQTQCSGWNPNTHKVAVEACRHFHHLTRTRPRWPIPLLPFVPLPSQTKLNASVRRHDGQGTGRI
jgi:hypothetical protein